MKAKIIKTIAALMLSLLSLPMMGQDYLKIYFKDGHTERHYMRLVESISTTKFDLEGNLHNDYQMQQIVMPDTTYSYYLTEIDSMAFRKVNVEEVKNLGESVQASLEPIFQQCSNFQDLESHIDEIKSIDGIEETYYDDNNLFIQIRDWPVICISRQRIPEDIAPSSISLGMQNIKSLVPTTDDGSSLKAIIGFQMKDDFWFMDAKVKIDLLNTKFSIMGYNPVYDLGEDVDFDFLYRRIFDSNILLIDTHGGCGIFNKKHYLYTGIVSSSNDFVGLNVDKWFNISENIDLDDIGVNSCYYEGDNLFNNPFGQRWYFTVTEDYIRKSPYRFEGEGPHIVFVAACSSLQGNNILTRSDGEQCYGNDSFAQVFFEKGADVYIGYNQGSYRSSFAANSFFDRMLHGASVEKAFDMLHSLYKYESDKDEQAKLVDLYNQNSKNPKGIFIVKTHTETKTDKEINEEFATNQQVKLNGTTFCWDLYEYPQIGFRISTEPNINESTTGIDVLSNDAHLTGEKYKEVAFSGVFKAEPGTTYYYRAYTYDYIHFNWGEERILTTPKKLELSVGSIFLNEGESTTVEITSGNGDYSVSVDKPSFATATLSGTTITIKGESKGTAKVTVKDKSGQTAEISVNVKEFISPYCPDNNHPHLIDLGLPSGTLWACCNVEATSPELSGGYYAWGETNTKDVYSWNTYSLCNGTKTSCRHIGEDIACTEYDVAHVKWGGQWVMPSREQIRELLDNCTQKKITLNGVNGTLVNGKNGSSIFLPFSGYRSGGSLQDEGTNSKYWSSSLDPNNEYYAYHFFFQSGGGYSSNSGYNYRYYGFTVRPIVSKELKLSQNSVEMFAGKSATVEIINGSGSFEISNSNANVVQAVLEGAKITLTAKTEGNAVVTVKDKSAGLTGSVSVTVKTIPNLVLSQNNVDLTIGAQATIEIISGSGEYGVTHLDDASSIAKATLNGSKININALIAGVAKIVVVDMQSGQKVVITITVETNAVAVNLGLPSGTLWADRNVGASTPEDAGEYYAWGETEYKPNNCTVNTYSLCTNGDASTCVSLGNIAGTQYDVAYVKWGTLWTIPTIEQAQELLDYCTFEWNTVNTVKGFTVTGLNGNSIFIPAAGCHHGGVTQNGGVGIDLWLSEQNDRRIDWAAEITSNYYGDTPYIDQRMDRYFGLFVRPVKTSHTNPLSLELKSINLMLDESISFEVTSGNGDYGISYIDNANTIIDATINGTIVTVNALNAGNAKFAVTDITGRMALVTVVVIEDPVEPLSHEHESLMQLFKDTNGNFWIHNDNWRSDKSLDKWYGISLNSSGKVTNIRLSNNNLSGNVSIREFTSLYNIELVGNNLSSIVIDSCPELDLGYGFRGLNGITADYVNINNCLSGQGQHFLNDANIKIIEFSNLINCGRIFLRGVTAEKVIIRNSEFPSQAIFITEGNNVDTLLVEDSNVWSNLGPDANHLIIKNSIVNKWWQIGAKMSITLENATIEGQTFTITGTPEEVNNYLRQFIN